MNYETYKIAKDIVAIATISFLLGRLYEKIKQKKNSITV